MLGLAVEVAKDRIEVKLVREQGITRLLVRAFQGHYNEKAERALSDEMQWQELPTEEAEKLLAIHATSYEAACQIMKPGGTMEPKNTRGYLHFSTAADATSLDQMNQLRDGSAYLFLNMKQVAKEYKVLRNKMGTITLKTKQSNEIVRAIGRHYLQFCLNR